MHDINDRKSQLLQRRSSGTGTGKRKTGMQVLKAPPSPLMSLDSLVAAVKRFEAQRPLTDDHEEAIWGRDLLLLALMISNPLRARNLRELTYRPDGTGHLRRTAQGEWRIFIHRQEFMNPWERRSYDMRVDRSVWPYVERYVTSYRHMLGECRPELVFASSNAPDRAWWGLSQRMKALTGRNLRCPGVAPQDIRHIVASSIIEKTGNFRLAAAVLHCSPAVLKKHYSHLLAKFDSRNTNNFCMDCRVDTEKNGEYYMLHHELWYSINRQYRGKLCLRCVERRLGRDLTSADCLDAPINSIQANNSIQAKLCAQLARRLARPA
jgi:hypothetical protein